MKIFQARLRFRHSFREKWLSGLLPFIKLQLAFSGAGQVREGEKVMGSRHETVREWNSSWNLWSVDIDVVPAFKESSQGETLHLRPAGSEHWVHPNNVVESRVQCAGCAVFKYPVPSTLCQWEVSSCCGVRLSLWQDSLRRLQGWGQSLQRTKETWGGRSGFSWLDLFDYILQHLTLLNINVDVNFRSRLLPIDVFCLLSLAFFSSRLIGGTFYARRLLYAPGTTGAGGIPNQMCNIVHIWEMMQKYQK